MTQNKHALTQRGDIAVSVLIGLLANEAFCKSVAKETQCRQHTHSLLVTEAFDMADMVMVADEHGVEAIEHGHSEPDAKAETEPKINVSAKMETEAKEKMTSHIRAFIDSLDKTRAAANGTGPKQAIPAPEKETEVKVHIVGLGLGLDSDHGSIEKFLLQAFNRRQG